MKQLFWLLVMLFPCVLGYALWRWRRRLDEQKRAAEARLASFMAQTARAAAEEKKNKVTKG